MRFNSFTNSNLGEMRYSELKNEWREVIENLL